MRTLIRSSVRSWVQALPGNGLTGILPSSPLGLWRCTANLLLRAVLTALIRPSRERYRRHRIARDSVGHHPWGEHERSKSLLL